MSSRMSLFCIDTSSADCFAVTLGNKPPFTPLAITTCGAEVSVQATKSLTGTQSFWEAIYTLVKISNLNLGQ